MRVLATGRRFRPLIAYVLTVILVFVATLLCYLSLYGVFPEFPSSTTLSDWSIHHHTSEGQVHDDTHPEEEASSPLACPIPLRDHTSDHGAKFRIPEPSPIDELIRRAHADFSNLLSRETTDLRSAAAAYRTRRGRHPPPRFDEWVQWAQRHDVLLIEEFFDVIYRDLEPFWGIPPEGIRAAAAGHDFVISIRDGSVVREDTRNWMRAWRDMLVQLNGLLPDVDLAFNHMDEPRVIAPWEMVAQAMELGASRNYLNIDNEFIVSAYAHLPEYIHIDQPATQWIRQGNPWVLARDACPPTSEARTADAVVDFAVPLDFPVNPNLEFHGFVSNWTMAKDPCVLPHLRSLHGSFIEPISTSTSKKLFPIFGGSKLSVNNDILVPAPVYWWENPVYAIGKETCQDWDGKRDQLIWRGVASGGRNKAETWHHFQRHRLMSMLNASHIRDMLQPSSNSNHLVGHESSDLVDQKQGPRPPLFQRPDANLLNNISALHEPSDFVAWVQSFVGTAGFVDLECFPKPPPGTDQRYCSYTDPFYEILGWVDMPTMFNYKYLPDIDGNSFSGRYRGLLQSHSLPIKATVYNEWHDSRLVPWKHFVPMDNTFSDFYGIMDYFLGYKGSGANGEGHGAKSGHDEAARKIALDGHEWAKKVLRKEDMLAYMYRLVLEYARIADDRRERMGFVQDLI